MNIEIVRVNYNNPVHAEALTALMQHYALDPMGGGKALTDECINSLIDELAKRDYAFSVIAFVDNNAAGLVNCFEAFSTFSCSPLINIHDVVVSNDFRGLAISQKMLARVEEIARQKKCCKLTLEVLSGNIVAKSAYKKFGFDDYTLDPAVGHALFWEKKL